MGPTTTTHSGALHTQGRGLRGCMWGWMRSLPLQPRPAAYLCSRAAAGISVPGREDEAKTLLVGVCPEEEGLQAPEPSSRPPVPTAGPFENGAEACTQPRRGRPSSQGHARRPGRGRPLRPNHRF